MTNLPLRLFTAGMPAILLAAAPLAAAPASPDLSRLPDWAQAAVLESQRAVPPKDAEAWVLLDRTELAYTGDGEIREHHFRVVQVLGERGVAEGAYELDGDSAATAKVKKLKGWNLRPDGEVTRMDLDDAFAVEGRSDEEAAFTTKTWTAGELKRVVKGSLLAFESLEVVRSPLGPVESLLPLQRRPVLRWECAAAKKEGWFSDLKAVELRLDLARTAGWNLKIHQEPGLVSIQDLPALAKPEPYLPPGEEILPQVRVRFLDPDLKATPDWSTWDGLARFTSRSFQTDGTAGLPAEAASADPKGRLDAFLSWMDAHLTYRQVYLSPARGWIPEKPAETGRKRYGDCKDFAAFFIAGARRSGLVAAPALAAISEARMDPSFSPGYGFNHVIAAVKLDRSLGLPAEVQTPAGRFLLVDPTDHGTPFGQLGAAHRGRWVMICLPDRGVWVQIPDSALAPEAIHYQLKGALDDGRTLTAHLRIEERGDARGLRQVAQESTQDDFRKWLRGELLSLPASATCTVVRQTDPADLGTPFALEIDLKVPQSFDSDGSEFDLRLPGFPDTPSKPEIRGEHRHFPLQSLAAYTLTYDAELTLPRPAQPILGSFQAQTSLRSLTWAASGGEAPAKPLHLQLQEERREAGFGLDKLDEGVKAFLADRAAMLKLNQDGLAFKILP